MGGIVQKQMNNQDKKFKVGDEVKIKVIDQFDNILREVWNEPIFERM